jgi:nitronate monooxygenase
MPTRPAYTFEQQLEAVLASGARAFSFTFGALEPDMIQRIRSRGLIAIGTATTVEEARTLESTGVDAVVAQGSEAGGHRGSFGTSDFRDAMIGTMALVPQIADAVSIPVIASGGLMDGRGIAAALVLGAAGAQMGTAFLMCDEAGIPECYKAAILAAREDGTRVTRAFSGRPARGIVNRFLAEMEASDPAQVLPFPLQNVLTRERPDPDLAEHRPGARPSGVPVVVGGAGKSHGASPPGGTTGRGVEGGNRTRAFIYRVATVRKPRRSQKLSRPGSGRSQHSKIFLNSA